MDTKKPFARLQLGMIASLFILTGAFLVNHIFAATGALSFVPSATAVNIGDTVTVAVRENSGTDLINAVEADVRYDATKLQFQSVSETGSAFGLVAATGASAGSINIARGRAGGDAPLAGDQLVTTITFRALASGSVQLTFAATSALVRSTDNTNVLVVTTPATLTLADTAAPTIPAGLAAVSMTMTSVSLTWSASTDNVGTTGYRIFRNGVQVGTSASTNFTNTGLLTATSYTFSVASVDAAGNVSAQSSAISAQTLNDTSAPSVPGIPTSPSQFITAISLAWTASTDNVKVESYKLFRNGVQIATPVTPSFTDQGLSPNTSYSYTVQAVDGSGNVSGMSAAAAFKTLADTVPPSIPANVVGAVTGTKIDLSWTASSDNIGVVGYLIYRDGVQVGTSPTATFTVAVAPTGTHIYTVAAIDAANNNSAQSTGTSISVFNVADINKDGKVDVFDISILLSHWSFTGVNSSDINGDSVVNIFDLSILLARWTG